MRDRQFSGKSERGEKKGFLKFLGGAGRTWGEGAGDVRTPKWRPQSGAATWWDQQALKF